MITYLGNLTIGAAVPLFANALATMIGAITGELANLASDAQALAGDVSALETDAASLASELAAPQGLADGILAQLSAGPTAVINGIEAAIASVLDGSSLRALNEALLGGPAAVLASLQSALAEAQMKIASLETRIAGLGARVLGIVNRASAVAERIAFLKDLVKRLSDIQGILANAGIHIFSFTGALGALGSELETAVAAASPEGAGPSDPTSALVLLTTAANPWAALSKVMKVTF